MSTQHVLAFSIEFCPLYLYFDSIYPICYSQANRELEIARTEIAHLHAERERYEETMKKAFMRGVCALNLEAMSMFREGEEGGRRPPPAASAINNGTISHLSI